MIPRPEKCAKTESARGLTSAEWAEIIWRERSYCKGRVQKRERKKENSWLKERKKSTLRRRKYEKKKKAES